MNNRGMSLGNLYPAVLAVIIVGVALGLGIYVLNETGDAISTTTITVINETVVGAATPGTAVATATDCGAHDFVISQVHNETVLLNSANYTFASNGYLILTTANEFIGDELNVSYTYTGTTDTSSTGACGVLSTTSTGTAGFASWIAVIVVVLAAAIVLGIVIGSFGKGSSA